MGAATAGEAGQVGRGHTEVCLGAGRSGGTVPGAVTRETPAEAQGMVATRVSTYQRVLSCILRVCVHVGFYNMRVKFLTQEKKKENPIDFLIILN